MSAFHQYICACLRWFISSAEVIGVANETERQKQKSCLLHQWVEQAELFL